MPRWRIQGAIDGELIGDLTRLDDGPNDAARLDDTAEYEDVYPGSPQWQEFWPDEGEAASGLAPIAGAADENTIAGASDQITIAGPLANEPDSASFGPIETDPSAKKLWLWAAAIALIGIFLRAVWFHDFPDEWAFRLGPDGDTYMTQAVGYLQGQITDPAAGMLPSIFREVFPPGYPLILSVLMRPFSNEAVRSQSDGILMTIRIFQWLLVAGITLMTFALARRVLIGYSALVPPALLTISAAWIDIPNLIAYETLLTFLLVAAILLAVKARESEGANRQVFLIGAAFAFGYGVLVQPRIAVVLPFLVVWLWRSLPRQLALAFMLLALVIPGAWIARNYVVYDEFVPISINGQASLYLDNVDPVGGAGFVRRAAPPQCPRKLLVMGTDSQRFEWARCMQRAGFNQIADHPAESAKAVPDRLAALISPWNPTRARGTYATDHWDYHSLFNESTRASTNFKSADRAALVLWLTAYTLLLLIGVITLWVEGPLSAARPIALPIIALPLIHLVFHAENRFRLPLTPFLMIAITLGAITVWEWIRQSVDVRHRH